MNSRLAQSVVAWLCRYKAQSVTRRPTEGRGNREERERRERGRERKREE